MEIRFCIRLIMFEELKNIKSTKKELRNFGITIGVILLVIGGYLFFKELGSYQTFLYLAIALIGLGLIIPNLLKPIYLIWMIFAVIIGWVMTRVILSLLFYFIITPIGIIAKILNKDFLNLKKEYGKTTYWNKRDRSLELNQDYSKQF